MSIPSIAKILDSHSVPYFINNGHIYADSMVAFSALFDEVVEMTCWSCDEIYSWLGY